MSDYAAPIDLQGTFDLYGEFLAKGGCDPDWRSGARGRRPHGVPEEIASRRAVGVVGCEAVSSIDGLAA